MIIHLILDLKKYGYGLMGFQIYFHGATEYNYLHLKNIRQTILQLAILDFAIVN